MQTTMPTLGEIIDRNAACSPKCHRLCFRTGDDPPHLRARVRRLASGLHRLGLGRRPHCHPLHEHSEYLEVYGAADWAGYILGT